MLSSNLCLLLVSLLVHCKITTSFVPSASSSFYHRRSFFLTAETDTTTTAFIFTENNDDSTVETITFPSGSCITLVGTAHLSKASNEQVERIMEEVKPDIVMVELDKSRIERIGYESMEDLQFSSVVTADDIIPPSQIEANEKAKNENKPWWDLPKSLAMNALLNTFTSVVRGLLTGMYDDMADQMNSDDGPGGEFKMAIEAGRKNGAKSLVLGDQASTQTIRRTVELAIESGDPFGVLDKLNSVNADLMKQLEERVRKELEEEGKRDGGGAEVVVDPSELSVAMMETLKTDTKFRTRLFEKLEQDVPEFTQAFITDRDYIMAESIRKELDKKKDGNLKVVGVVGLAHVPGIKMQLEQMMADSSM